MQTLKENRLHGTSAFPCALYHGTNHDKFLNIGYHWHPEVEVLYFRQGEYTLEINEQKYAIEEECYCFINQGELHSILSSPYFLVRALVFSPDMLGFNAFDQTQGEIIQPFINNRLLLPRFVFHSDPVFTLIHKEFIEIEHAFEKKEGKIENEVQMLTDNIGSQLLIKGALLKILCYLFDYQLLQVKTPFSEERLEGIKAALEYINRYYQKKIYLRDVAEAANMNEQHFSRMFKKIVGKTPIEYLNEFRIKQSIFLLEDTSQQVSEIHLKCGFHNKGNFLREFRKFTSCTPLQYRKSLLNKGGKSNGKNMVER